MTDILNQPSKLKQFEWSERLTVFSQRNEWPLHPTANAPKLELNRHKKM
ncbi:9967_t:CDS:2 [Acaulospora morrowiae]|uniref:9967_t:CDS:1 n=1 Tax=Acaulospora morrowiae TaxID=94023 RepID=A0A9N8Z3T0_9GLOM|nr:9967_t:CDS:2 [Acaulospora morrowiae]